MTDPREQFGPQAEFYLKSAVHSNVGALSRLVDAVNPRGGTVLDVATGAGHTAYAFAPFVDRVIATDITPNMLRVTQQVAEERSLGNIEVLFAEAENLPIRAGALDGVTCRLGAHHFANVCAFVRESSRALHDEGWLVLADTVGTEGDEADAQIDLFERTRDPSHVRNYKRSQWLNLISNAGFSIEFESVFKKEIDAEDWMERMNVSDVDRGLLREMINESEGEFAAYLQPGKREGRLYFHLDEILIYARKRK